jgi:hypothetical protein
VSVDVVDFFECGSPVGEQGTAALKSVKVISPEAIIFELKQAFK